MDVADRCLVYGCSNWRSKGHDLLFHPFPINAGARAKWVQAVKRMDFVVSSSSCLCSVHFQ